MPVFRFQEIRNLETTSTNPTQLKSKVGDMILSSTDVHAKVESINPETGEYRLVLQGTLVEGSRL